MTKRVIEGEQSIMGTIFFIFKVNTVEKGPFPMTQNTKSLPSPFGLCMSKHQLIKSHNIAKYSRKFVLSYDKRRLVDTYL